MKLELQRTTYTDISTIGKLFIDGKFFCYTLEDKDRGLLDSMNLLTIKARKIFGVTAIPKGKYSLTVSMSNRFKRFLPEIHNVKGYEGIRIHRGNYAGDSLGCIIVGARIGVDAVFESTTTETALVRLLSNGENHTIEIK
ncbi:MAG: hypothetical protein IPP56_13825 [Bacteroidetes bacterium]|nr:hypothetical protein [Bacteroidota bacterium]